MKTLIPIDCWETVEHIGVECVEGIWHWKIETNESE